MTIDLNSIFSSFAALASITAIVVALKNRGKSDGTIQSDLGYIKSQLDRIIEKQEKQDELNIRMQLEIAECKNAVQALHKRVDLLEGHYHPD